MAEACEMSDKEESETLKKEESGADAEMEVDGSSNSNDVENGMAQSSLENQTEDGPPESKSPKTADGAETEDQPCVSFKVHNGRKQTFDMSMSLNATVLELKKNIRQKLPELSPVMKLICKSRQLQDDQSLSQSQITNGTKVLLMASTVDQIVSANTKPSADEIKAAQTVVQKKEPLCTQKPHSIVIQNGVPDDVMPGIKNVKENLPPVPLKGMRNNKSRPLRLTFKLELDQLWVGTPERTNKIPMGQINDIVSEPIEEHEEYHMMGIKIGSTEASRIWVYWVPAQYVDAIKKTILE